MEDNKVSHMDYSINSMIAHMFLGTNINFIGRKKVTVSMSHHVDDALKYFGETLRRNVMNPATSQLFAIASESKELDDDEKERYHSISAKILWIMKHSYPDLETALSFLCTRVQCPNEEYLGGLRRALNYLKVTKDDKRIMGSVIYSS